MNSKLGGMLQRRKASRSSCERSISVGNRLFAPMVKMLKVTASIQAYMPDKQEAYNYV